MAFVPRWTLWSHSHRRPACASRRRRGKRAGRPARPPPCSAFPTPPWTAQARPTRCTGIILLDLDFPIPTSLARLRRIGNRAVLGPGLHVVLPERHPRPRYVDTPGIASVRSKTACPHSPLENAPHVRPSRPQHQPPHRSHVGGLGGPEAREPVERREPRIRTVKINPAASTRPDRDHQTPRSPRSSPRGYIGPGVRTPGTDGSRRTGARRGGGKERTGTSSGNRGSGPRNDHSETAREVGQR